MTPEPTGQPQDTPTGKSAKPSKKVLEAKAMVEANLRKQASEAVERIARDLNEMIYYMTCPRHANHVGIIFNGVNPANHDRFNGTMWYAFHHGVHEGHKDIFWGQIPGDIICQDCYANCGGEKVQLRVHELPSDGPEGKVFGIQPRHKREYIRSMRRAELEDLMTAPAEKGVAANG